MRNIPLLSMLCCWLAWCGAFPAAGQCPDSLAARLEEEALSRLPLAAHQIGEELGKRQLPLEALDRCLAVLRAVAEARNAPPEVKRQLRLPLLRRRIELEHGSRLAIRLVADTLQEHYQYFKEEDFRLGMAETAAILAFYHKHVGQLEQSLRLALEASDLYEEMGMRQDALLLYVQIALEHYLSGSHSYARFYLQKAMSGGLQNLPVGVQLQVLHLLGQLYEQEGEPEPARTYFREVERLARKHADSTWLGIARGNLAVLYFDKGQYDSAEVYFREDLRHGMRREAWPQVAITLHRLGDIDRLQGRWADALGHYGQAKSLFEAYPEAGFQPHWRHDTYDRLSQAYAAVGQPEAAYQAARQALLWNDSLMRRNLSATVERIQREHEWEKQASLASAHELAQWQELKAQKAQNYALLVGCASLALLFGAALLLNRKLQDLNRRLKQTNDEVLEKNAYIEQQNLELEQQQEEIATQNDLLQATNKTLREEEAFMKSLLQDLMEGSEEIEMQNQRLEDEIKQRTQELIVKSQELARYNQQLEGFAYVTAHNIRGPIARLKGLISIFDRASLHADNRQIWSMLAENTDEVDEIVQDLSAMLEVRSNIHVSFEDMPLAQGVDKALQLLRAPIEASHAAIELRLQAGDIYTIRPYLENIFYQLLSNAIKFRATERPLRIGIHAWEEGPNIRVEVSDNGMGIDLGKHGEHLFGMYKRFHLHAKGKGLGLHLAKVQVENLHGHIELRSREGEGTTVTLTLPIHPGVVVH